MIRQSVILLFVLFAAVAARPYKSFGQDPTAKRMALEKLLLDAKRDETKGDLHTAHETYDQVERQAAELGENAAEADAALNKGRIIEALAQKGEDKSRVDAAEQAYEHALSIGTARQRLLAGNDLCVLLTNQGKYGEAVERWRSVNYSELEPSERFVYDYNFGRALEGNGNFKEAYEKYKRSVMLQPKFDAAGDAAFRVLQKNKVFDSTPQSIEEAANLAAAVLAGGGVDLAARQLRSSLELWSTEPAAQNLLAVLLRYYVAAPIDEDDFTRSQADFLSKLSHGPLGGAIGEVFRAYMDNFRPAFTRHPELSEASAVELFPVWTESSPPQRNDFSRLLKRIGDFFDAKHDPMKALERYSVAWAIDDQNEEAVLYAAGVLRDNGPAVDPDGTLFKELIDSVFFEKSEAYRERKSADIFRLHLVLGNIFEKREQWGSPDETQSAVFQLQHAALTDEVLRQEHPDRPPVPGLHLSLANVYRHLPGELPSAWDEYLRAASGFVETLRGGEAAMALHEADALGIGLDSSRRERLEKLRASIASLHQ
jgi:tetratricopeptide (TPR) repeat protein